MGKTLQDLAQGLKDNSKKVQLIYAFNGIGKTRLSCAFNDLVSPTQMEGEDTDETKSKILYYNAFTEDLFYWGNDSRKLKIQHNSFTRWILEEQGQESNIITNFQHYTNDKLTPKFSKDYSEIAFSIEGGNDERIEDIKISKGEESCLIWCVFYSLLEQVVEVLSEPEPAERENNQFDDLEYIFIDDPVSSLDENHLIELAVNIAELVKKAPTPLKFIITTHNPLFYNVLYNELPSSKSCYMLKKSDDGTFDLEEKQGDSNKSFSYHLFLKQTLEEAIESNSIQKYHFTLLRNLYEKTANFLGYPRWQELLPDDKQTYYKRIINFTSHSTLSGETVAEPTDVEKQTVKFLLNHLVENRFWKENKS